MEGASSFFSPDGALSRLHPQYEPRPGQEAMARAVERVLETGGRLLVEAGTGTGKTLAYLVPAVAAGRRVVVSTGTKNLQDQIFEKDIPFLREAAGMRFRAVRMKGRDNYLCRYRFEQFSAQPLLEVREEAPFLPVLRAWSRTTASGDRAEVGGLPDGLRLWRDVNARADTCTGSKCPEYDACYVTRLKREAQEAQIVVVNHHLFFADLAIRSAYGSVLPDYDTVVFDEAHLLEETATLFFGAQVSSAQVEEVARSAERGAGKGGGGAAALREASQAFFGAIRRDLRDLAGRVRFEPPTRGGPELDLEWAALSDALAEVARLASGNEASESVAVQADEVREGLEAVLDRGKPDHVYGVESRGRGTIVLSAAPIDVSSLLRERLFDGLHAAILTSATLAVGGRFDFFRSRLGLDEAETAVVDSPFDHARQAVLYLPRRMPEPREREFASRAIAEIRSLLSITEGRAFVLFTSHAALQRARVDLEEDGWSLLVQGDAPKAALVETFRRTDRAVLLGTSSFWHGVDVQGEALSLVIVDKLPFDVPSDPLVAARIERIREAGGNPFAEYQTPLAVLELKQGLGRLLRSRVDRGILAVLDPRITTKAYGKTFLASLPPYRVVRDLEACAAFFHGPKT